MRPSEKFSKVVRLIRLCAATCGADVFSENYKINGVTGLVVFCITVYFLFTAYTIQLKISENWTVALEAFCMVGSVLQGISKLVSGIRHEVTFRAQSEFLRRVYVTFERRGDDYVQVLSNAASRVVFILKLIASMYTILGFSSAVVPFLIWTLSGRRLFVMQFFLPGIDPETTVGYLATNGMQITCLIFGLFGNFAGDMFMLVFFSHSTLIVDIFALKVRELNVLCSDLGRDGVMQKLSEVIEWHQTYSDFIDDNSNIFYWVNFTEIATSGLSIVLTLVIIFNGEWPGSYVYIVYCFLMMYFYCGMGSLVEVANDRMTDEIYAIHWYEMTVPQQKSVRFMLMKSQSAKKITVGGVAPLSINTGLQVTKTVYSVFMMLLNFF